MKNKFQQNWSGLIFHRMTQSSQLHFEKPDGKWYMNLVLNF